MLSQLKAMTFSSYAASPTLELSRTVDISSYGNLLPWQVDAMLLRFLRARKFNLSATVLMLKANIQFRTDFNVRHLATFIDPDDVFDDPSVNFKQLLMNFYPHMAMGFDKTGRPVAYKMYGKMEVWELLKVTTLEKLVLHHIWEQEFLFGHMLKWTASRGYLCETMTAIIDIKGMSMRHITKDFLLLVKQLASIDQNHYPERMGRVYIINTGAMFSLVWRGITPWLDRNTASKFRILSSEKEWKPVFEQEIGLDQLPPLYGGTNDSYQGVMGIPFGCVETAPEGREGGLLRQHSAEVNFAPDIPAPGIYDIFDGELHNDDDDDGDDPRVISERDQDRMSDDDFQSARDAGSDVGPEERALHRLETGGSEGSFRERSGSEKAVSPKVPRPPNRCEIFLTNPIFRLCFSGKTGRSHLTNCLAKQSLRRLCILSDLFNGVLMILSVSIIGVISRFISSNIWEQRPELVTLMLWIAVCLVAMCALMTMLGFCGIVAVHSQNQGLLHFHWAFLIGISIIFTIIFIVSLFFNFGPDGVELGQKSVSFLSNEARAVLSNVHSIVSAASGLLAAFAIVPGSLSRACGSRFGRIVAKARGAGITDAFYRSARQRIVQTRMVLRMSNLISLAFAVSCVVYGIYGTRVTLHYALEFSAYTPFLLTLLGVVLIILSMLAFWASSSRNAKLFVAYKIACLPFLCCLLAFSCLSLFQVDQIDGKVKENWDSMTKGIDETVASVSSKLKAILLVTGIMEAMTSFFFVQNLIVSWVLHRNVVKSQRAVTWREQQLSKEAGLGSITRADLAKLSPVEFVVVVLEVLIGVHFIFFDGSFLVFNNYVEQSSGWATELFRLLGKIDTRYLEADAFMAAYSFCFAAMCGPACLWYAWALATKKSFSHLLGVVVSVCSLYSEVSYIFSEGFFDWVHFKGEPNAVTYFVLEVLIRAIFPIFIISRELKLALGGGSESEDLSERLKNYRDQDMFTLEAAHLLFGGNIGREGGGGGGGGHGAFGGGSGGGGDTSPTHEGGDNNRQHLHMLSTPKHRLSPTRESGLRKRGQTGGVRGRTDSEDDATSEKDLDSELTALDVEEMQTSPKNRSPSNSPIPGMKKTSGRQNTPFFGNGGGASPLPQGGSPVRNLPNFEPANKSSSSGGSGSSGSAHSAMVLHTTTDTTKGTAL